MREVPNTNQSTHIMWASWHFAPRKIDVIITLSTKPEALI